MQKQKKTKTQLAVENFEIQREHLKKEGYVEHEAIISVLAANTKSMLLALPLIAIFFTAFLVVWKDIQTDTEKSLVLLLFFLISIVIHEWLHGFGWSLSCKDGFKSVRFGMMWSKMTPYCNCKELLGFKQYLLGSMLPLLILGLIPSAIALFLGNVYLLYFGALGIIGAGGDMLISLNMRKYPKALFLDHPKECGFFAFEKISDKNEKEV